MRSNFAVRRYLFVAAAFRHGDGERGVVGAAVVAAANVDGVDASAEARASLGAQIDGGREGHAVVAGGTGDHGGAETEVRALLAGWLAASAAAVVVGAFLVE